MHSQITILYETPPPKNSKHPQTAPAIVAAVHIAFNMKELNYSTSHEDSTDIYVIVMDILGIPVIELCTHRRPATRRVEARRKRAIHDRKEVGWVFSSLSFSSFRVVV
jgi:hypothetical protein